MASLKPCPFCGDAAPVVHAEIDGLHHLVSCPTCHCEGPTDESDEGASECWNKRHSEPVANAVVETNPADVQWGKPTNLEFGE